VDWPKRSSTRLAISSLHFGFYHTQISGNPYSTVCVDKFEAYSQCLTGSTTDFDDSSCDACFEAEVPKHSGVTETSACADIVAATCSVLTTCGNACSPSKCTDSFAEFVLCSFAATDDCPYQCNGISGGSGGSNNGNAGSGSNNGGGSPTGSGTGSDALGISTFLAFAFVPFMIALLS
jgi:uncharacterized membrane protein YgcG